MANEKKKVVRRIKASTDGAKSSKVVATATVPKPQLDDSSLIQTEKTSADTHTADKKAKSNSDAKTKQTHKKPEQKTSSEAKLSVTVDKKDKKYKKRSNNQHKPFILFRPFIAFGHYIRDSWRELRKVEWPSRRATWKMTLGVIIFCVFIGVFVLLCDWGSQWLIQEVVL